MNITRKAVVTFIEGAAAYASGVLARHWGLDMELSVLIAAAVAAVLSIAYNTVRASLHRRGVEIVSIDLPVDDMGFMGAEGVPGSEAYHAD